MMIPLTKSGDLSIGVLNEAALFLVELEPVAVAVTDPEPGEAVPVEVPPEF